MKKVFLSVLTNILLTSLPAQTLSSSNLPIIILNTGGQTIPDEPKITADMGIIYNGEGVRNNLTDPMNHYSGKIGIEIRGQSSQMFPMKSYSVELRDATGSSLEKSLFGMPKSEDWVLYAPYTDKTLMRNFLAYTLSNEMGRWAAHCRFVEVVLNGQYIGIYVFMERIKRSSGRVNITKMSSSDISGDAVTGGYIFKLDKEPDGWQSAYPPPNSDNSKRRRYSYVYPKVENMVQPQKDYIKSYVDSFENAMASPDFQDPVIGGRKYIDAPSFIDYLIVNELSRNVDGYRFSAYFYKDRNSKNSKIFAGPVWDYDLAFRNANYCEGSNVNGWGYMFNFVCPGDGGLIPFYWNKLADKDTAFRAALRCRWKNLRQTTLSEQRIGKLIDSIAFLTAEARQRHFQKWPILGKYVWPNPEPIPANYEGEITSLKQWIRARLDWLDRNMPNQGACEDWPEGIAGTMLASVFPNPLSSFNSIVIKTKISQPIQLQVMDALGKTVYSQQIQAVPVSNYITNVHTETWARGVYFFIFSTQSGEKIIRKLAR
jgi:hypothetical protein